MKRILSIIILLISIRVYSVEITNFRVSQENQRYRISAQIPASYDDSVCDVFLFFKSPGESSWHKARAIVGRHLNIDPSHPLEQLYWDPVFEFRPWGSYEFKVYVVKQTITSTGYNYQAVDSVALLYGLSSYPELSIRVNGYSFNNATGPIALPAGRYTIHVMDRNTALGSLQVDLTPFSYNEIDFDELLGSVTIQSNNPRIRFSLDGGEFSSRNSYRLLHGTHLVTAKADQSDPTYPQIISSREIVIEAGRTETISIELLTGTLNVSANRAGVSYEIEGTRFQRVRDLLLRPGLYSVKVYDSENQLLETMPASINPGEITELRFTLNVESQQLDTRPETARIATTPQETPPPNQIPPVTRSTSPVTQVQAVTEPQREEKLSLSKWIFPLEELSYLQKNLREDDYDLFTDVQALTISGLGRYYFMNSDPSFRLILSLGALDKVYIPYIEEAKKLNVSFDALSLGLGMGIYSFNHLLGLEFSARYAYGYQYPVYHKVEIDTMAYEFFHELYQGTTEDGNRERSASKVSPYNSLEGRVELQLNFSENYCLYAFGTYKSQPNMTGNWYRPQEVRDWVKFRIEDRPSPSFNTELPPVYTAMGGEHLGFGIGIRYRLWPRARS